MDVQACGPAIPESQHKHMQVSKITTACGRWCGLPELSLGFRPWKSTTTAPNHPNHPVVRTNQSTIMHKVSQPMFIINVGCCWASWEPCSAETQAWLGNLRCFGARAVDVQKLGPGISNTVFLGMLHKRHHESNHPQARTTDV